MTSLVRAELQRFFATRIWLIALAAAVVCGFGLAGLVAVIGPENSQPPLPPLGTPEGVSVLLGLVQITLFVPATLGTFAVTSEYRHGTIGTTFLQVPQRGRVMAAKFLAHAIIGAAYGIVLALGAGLAIVLGSALGPGTLGVPAADLVSSLVRLAAAAAIHTLIGVAIGALVRNQVAGIAVTLGWFYLLEPVVMIIPGVNLVYGILPGGAAAALTRSTWLSQVIAEQTAGPTALVLAPWAGGLLLLGYAVAAAAVSVAVPLRRDLA